MRTFWFWSYWAWNTLLLCKLYSIFYELTWTWTIEQMSIFVFAGSVLHAIKTNLSISCLLTVLAITYDRFLGICFPMNTYTTWRQISMKRIVTAIWLVAAITAFPENFCFHTVTYDTIDSSVTLCLTSSNHLVPRVFHGVVSCLFLLVFVIFLHYINRMTLALSRNNRRNRDKTIVGNRKTITLLIVVAITLSVCLLPHHVLSILTAFDPDIFIRHIGYDHFSKVFEFLQILVFLNSALNPIIYNFTSSKFNVAFKELICMESSMDEVRVTRVGSEIIF